MKEIHPETRAEWRAWLRKNHKRESKVWLLKHKRHTGKPQVNNSDAMDEAICWGWIDTIIKRIDDDTYTQCFVRRTDKSRWSRNTLARAERMIEAGLMTKEGLKRYEEGKNKPTIDHNLPKNPRTPQDLKRAFTKKAEENWKSFPPSSKKYFIYWIEKAKRPETRAKRVTEVALKVKEGRKQ